MEEDAGHMRTRQPRRDTLGPSLHELNFLTSETSSEDTSVGSWRGCRTKRSKTKMKVPNPEPGFSPAAGWEGLQMPPPCCVWGFPHCPQTRWGL